MGNNKKIKYSDEDLKAILKDDIARYGYAIVKGRVGIEKLKKYGLLSRLDKALLKSGRGNEINECRTVIL